MAGGKLVYLLLTCSAVLIYAQYNDVPDYDDFTFNDEPSYVYQEDGSRHKIKQDPEQDDFYISEFDESVPESLAYPLNDDIELVLANDDGEVELVKPRYQQLQWYNEPARVYQYTKHRIPGYDYEELEFNGARRIDTCDGRSTWSHCACQFTCSNPDEVDCYMPCISGCECKEEYVFDELTRKCIPPEHCPLKVNDFVANE